MDGDNFLKGVNPERLLILDIEQISPMLNAQYGALVERGSELLDHLLEFVEENSNADGKLILRNDGQMNHASDLYRQVQSFCGAQGETEETRKRVKIQPWQACKAIDAWFSQFTDRFAGVLAVITQAQNERANKIREDERMARIRAVAAAEAEAKRLLEEARKAATPETLDRAIQAETVLEEAQIAVAAPAVELTRTRSALGVTTSQSEKWTYEVDDIRALCAAVAASGQTRRSRN